MIRQSRSERVVVESVQVDQVVYAQKSLEHLDLR